MESQQQTVQYPVKKFAAFSFIGGMFVIGALWVGSSLMTSNSGLRYSTVSDSSYMVGSAPTASGSIGTKMGEVTNVVGNMTQDRKVTTNYLSVHVKKVGTFHEDVTAFVKSVSGKVMTEYVTVSSDNQSESGTMTVLVPNKDSDRFFALVGDKVLKVVDRQVNSYQITQEYTDIERQLAQYEETYARILKYYNKANSVTDLLQVQNQLDQVQRNIDGLKGRKMALDELSINTQYTLYSSTNEFNLPYVPQGTFEFAKTFKLAVRSLVATTDKFLAGAIYLVVYLPVVFVFGLVVWGVKKVMAKQK